MIPNDKGKKVLVGLSGGVDSSVAAALLSKKGYEVEGAYMQCWSQGPYCSTEKDRADANRVAAHLGIPFHIFNFEKEYKKAVLDYFFSEYEGGRTPNPDVICNKEIKFGLFLKEAMDLGFDYIATGHYARVTNGRGYHLLSGVDNSKDQSYFLYNLKQDQLAKVLFPIGDYKKGEVRKLANKLNLPTAEKPDSQGICFIGPVNVSQFLRENIKNNPGDIVSTDGEVLGKHDGLAFFTIGQREGVGVSRRVPHYVVEKRNDTNELVVAPVGSKKLFKDHLAASQVSWTGVSPEAGDKVQARIRYRQPLVDATIDKVGEDTVSLSFNEPQRAVSPGQSVVIYRDLQSLRSDDLKDLRSLRPRGLKNLRSLRSGDLNNQEVLGGAVIEG